MPVYVIRAGASGPVKIGVAGDPMHRLIDLQVAHYEELKIIRLLEGGATEEAALHVMFADLHIRGEWFAFSRLMMADVGLTDVPLGVVKELTALAAGRGDIKLRSYLDREGIPRGEFARRIRVSAQALHRYMTGERRPRPEVMARISAETVGVIQPNDFFDVSIPIEAA